MYFIDAFAIKLNQNLESFNIKWHGDEYVFYLHLSHDHNACQNEALEFIEKGSFGKMIKAYDHKTTCS